MGTHFVRLNEGWNAEPNAPYPSIRADGITIILSFFLNPWAYPAFSEGDVGELRFSGCWRYRLGPPNDEGWWRRQCRFSLLAPDWGEFYEVSGDLRLDSLPAEAWTIPSAPPPPSGSRHFLFYFRDETFECDALDWSFRSILTA